MAASANRSKQKSSSPVLAIGVLFLVGGLLIAVIYVGGIKRRLEAEKTGEATELVENEDPFAEGADAVGGESEEQPESKPVKSRRVSDDNGDPFASMDDPFAATYAKEESKLIPRAGELTGSKLWKQGMKEADVVGFKLMLAAEAREQGDSAEEKAYREEAIEALEEALDTTKRWAETTVAGFSPKDVQVRSVVRTRKKWADQAKDLRSLVKN